jgi:hypothetical protein
MNNKYTPLEFPVGNTNFAEFLDGIKDAILVKKEILDKNPSCQITVKCPKRKELNAEFKMDFELWLHGLGLKIFNKSDTNTEWVIRIRRQNTLDMN